MIWKAALLTTIPRYQQLNSSQSRVMIWKKTGSREKAGCLKYRYYFLYGLEKESKVKNVSNVLEFQAFSVEEDVLAIN